jgi:hypothetical protein
MKVNIDLVGAWKQCAQQSVYVSTQVWAPTIRKFPDLNRAPFAKPIYTFWLGCMGDELFTRLTGIQPFGIRALVDGKVNPSWFDLMRLYHAGWEIGDAAADHVEFFGCVMAHMMAAPGFEVFFMRAVWELTFRRVLGQLVENEKRFRQAGDSFLRDLADSVAHAAILRLRAALERDENPFMGAGVDRRWLDELTFPSVWVGSVVRQVVWTYEKGPDTVGKEWKLFGMPTRQKDNITLTPIEELQGITADLMRRYWGTAQTGFAAPLNATSGEGLANSNPLAPLRRGKGRPPGAKNKKTTDRLFSV